MFISIILDQLAQHYSDGGKTELLHTSPFQLLIATILSAQCTDKIVNATTPGLFDRFPTSAALAQASQEDVEQLIRRIGLYRNKTKFIRAAATRIETVYGGVVPDTMDELLTLPGVARKTANVILYNCFGKQEGIVVDTHVQRISKRLGLAQSSTPVQIERELMNCLPRESWGVFSHRIILHGRALCMARNPKCAVCFLNNICPKVGIASMGEEKVMVVQKSSSQAGLRHSTPTLRCPSR